MVRPSESHRANTMIRLHERHRLMKINEPHHEKTNNVVYELFRLKPCCTSKEDGKAWKFWI